MNKKMEYPKKDWQLWTSLLRNETDLGWNPIK